MRPDGGARAATLIVPGWPVRPGDADPDAPPPRSAEEAAARAGGWPDVPGVPRIEWRRGAVEPVEATLLRALGMPLPPGAPVPSANAWREDLEGDARADVEAGLAAGEAVLRADPVHLAPDRDTALLHAPEALGLARAESDALVGALADFVAVDGLRLHAASPERWYLVGPGLPASPLPPPQSISGRRLADLDADDVPVPGAGTAPGTASGAGAGLAPATLRGLASELEMLLHGHPVNAARRAGGRPPVTGLYLHGRAEAWPAAVARAPDAPAFASALVVADDAFARAAASVAGAERAAGPDAREAAADPSRAVVVYERALERAVLAGDADAAVRELERLARAWLTGGGPDGPDGEGGFELHAGDGRVGFPPRERHPSRARRALGALVGWLRRGG